MKHVHQIIKKHTIGDGLDIVACPKKSHGSWVCDALTGNEYLDCYSSFASMPLGWNHPLLVEQVERFGRAAIHKIANSDMYCEDYASFVEEFASIAPDFKYFFFIDGGTLAVENAVKAAFDYKMHKLNYKQDFMSNGLDVIHLEHAFHGRSGYALSLTNTKLDKIWGFPKFPWTRLINPCTSENAVELSLAQAECAMRNGNVAAVILEPIQGEGGDIHLPIKWMNDLRILAHKYDVMFIVDEVQTGVGLTGKMWSYEHFGDLSPDMMCFGKKTQVCGFACTHKIEEVEDHVFAHSGRINSTWGGNIVDMVRFETISKIIKKEHLVENAAVVGDYFQDRLRSCNKIGHPRGRGLMLAFDMENTVDRDLFCHKVSDKMLVLKSGEKSVRLRPPLNFTKEDVNIAMEFIEAAA
jgi:L-lysine 6-transaminase